MPKAAPATAKSSTRPPLIGAIELQIIVLSGNTLIKKPNHKTQNIQRLLFKSLQAPLHPRNIMANINQVPDEISLESAFVNQESLQDFLDQSLSQNSSDSIDELLWLFIKIADKVSEKDGIQGIKLGYERAVLIDEESSEYRIESNFISNKNWHSTFDVNLLNEGFLFLSDTFEYPNKNENEEEDKKVRTLDLTFSSESLSKRMIDELIRRYPPIEECLEFHFYVILVKVNFEVTHSGNHDSSNLSTSNLIRRLCPEENFLDRDLNISIKISAISECSLCGEKVARGRVRDDLSTCKTC
jgi:hypothetical protein